MSLTCLLFFRWWHSSLVKIHADIRGKNRKKISVSVLSKCDPIWFHYYVVVHDFLQQKVRLSGSSLTSKNFSTEHLLFLPKFPVLNILSLINVSLIKKKACNFNHVHHMPIRIVLPWSCIISTMCNIQSVYFTPKRLFRRFAAKPFELGKNLFYTFFRPSKTALNHAFKFNVTSTSLAKQTQNECQSKLFGTFLTKIFEKFDLRPNQKTYWTQLSATLTHTP